MSSWTEPGMLASTNSPHGASAEAAQPTFQSKAMRSPGFTSGAPPSLETHAPINTDAIINNNILFIIFPFLFFPVYARKSQSVCSY